MDEGDNDAAVTVAAVGLDSEGEEAALAAVHRALRRGGTDQVLRKRAAMLATGVAVYALIVFGIVGVTYLVTGEWAGDFSTKDGRRSPLSPSMEPSA